MDPDLFEQKRIRFYGRPAWGSGFKILHATLPAFSENLAKLYPSTTVIFQADLAYGNKMNRIKGEAENIMRYERDLVEIPAGVPTLASVDAARIKLQVVVCTHWQCCGSASFRPVLRTPWHFGTDPDESIPLTKRIPIRLRLLLVSSVTFKMAIINYFLF